MHSRSQKPSYKTAIEDPAVLVGTEGPSEAVSPASFGLNDQGRIILACYQGQIFTAVVADLPRHEVRLQVARTSQAHLE